MSRRLPSLNALRTFEAAARHLSFSVAANELNVTQAAVSRQIRALEDDLGIKLFHRLTRAIVPTEEGVLLYPPLRDALDQMERATARVWNRKGGGLLTISVLPTFCVKWLMPRLLSFSEQHPEIEVHLVNSIKPADFDREDIDLAIRVGSRRENTRQDAETGNPRIDLKMVHDWEGLKSELLMPDELVAVMSPTYNNGAGMFVDEAAFANATLLQMATRPNAWPDYLRALGWNAIAPRVGPSFGHFFLTLQAAIEKKGVALLPSVLAMDDLRSGQLIRALPGTIRSSGDYYLLGRAHLWEQSKVRTFRDWLRAEIEISAADWAVISSC